MDFFSKKPHYEYLRKKWGGKQKSLQDKLFSSHEEVRKLAVGSLGGLLLLATPAQGALPSPHLLTSGNILKDTDRSQLLANKLKDQVPSEVRSLTPQEEDQIAQTLSQSFDLKAAPALEGVRLNRTYGLIGGEQHLYRYPGDNVYKHADNATDWAMYGGSGIAPGLGAWGYFSPTESQMTQLDVQRERYYIAVQTFLAPGFAENVAKHRDFFKYRKMLVVNPKTGQAVVADIADAGPSPWTGKHLGGSPEVMQAIGLAQGPRKGPVLYFFIDDPNNSVPLGPIKVSENMMSNNQSVN